MGATNTVSAWLWNWIRYLILLSLHKHRWYSCVTGLYLHKNTIFTFHHVLSLLLDNRQQVLYNVFHKLHVCSCTCSDKITCVAGYRSPGSGAMCLTAERNSLIAVDWL